MEAHHPKIHEHFIVDNSFSPELLTLSLRKTTMWKCYKALLVLLICPSNDLAEDAIVSSILEYIVGTLAHWTDHLLKLPIILILPMCLKDK